MLLFQFILKRNISKGQYIGALCIVASIIVANLDDVLTTSSNSIPSVAILLAAVASCISVAAALFTESFFKVVSIHHIQCWHLLIAEFWWELPWTAVLALCLWLPCLHHGSCLNFTKCWPCGGIFIHWQCFSWSHCIAGDGPGVQQHRGPCGSLHPQEVGQYCQGV